MVTPVPNVRVSPATLLLIVAVPLVALIW